MVDKSCGSLNKVGRRQNSSVDGRCSSLEKAVATVNRIAEGIAKAEAEIVTMKAVTTEQTAISEKSGKSKARCRAEEGSQKEMSDGSRTWRAKQKTDNARPEDNVTAMREGGREKNDQRQTDATQTDDNGPVS